MAALSLSSYVAMRARYCRTRSRDVTRPAFSAACISGIEASTTLKGLGLSLGCAAWTATAAERTMATTIRFMARIVVPRLCFANSFQVAVLVLHDGWRLSRENGALNIRGC